MLPSLIRGAGIAIMAAICAEVLGTILGLGIALIRLTGKRWMCWPAIAYVDVIRGTPLLVQILFIYIGLPGLVRNLTGYPFNPDALIAGTLALGLNSGAYVSEIYRTAIASIDRGQSEAAKALGLSWFQTMRFVVMPQALRWALPPLGNEFITLLKDTSLLSVISVMEIVKEGGIYMSRTYAAFPTYLGIAMVYLIMTLTISNALRLLERKLKVP